MVRKAQEPNIGARVKDARELLGLTQIEFAEKLDQAERTVQAWEGNTRVPRLDSLKEIGRLVDRPVAWFFGAGDVEPTGAAA